MSLNWLKKAGKRPKHITITALAKHYGVHRHTISKYARGVDLRDFWECVRLVQRLEAFGLGGERQTTPPQRTESREIDN